MFVSRYCGDVTHHRESFCSQSERFVVRAGLPAGLDDAWDLALERQCTEAQTADAELAQERARTAAELAAVVLAGLELRLCRVFHSFCCSCHIFFALFLNPDRMNWSFNLLARSADYPAG